MSLELAMTLFSGLSALVAVISAFIARRQYIERREISIHKLKVYLKAMEMYLTNVKGLHECWKNDVTQLVLRFHPKVHEAYPFNQDDLNELAMIDKGKLYSGSPIVFVVDNIRSWYCQHYVVNTNTGDTVIVYTLPNQTSEHIRFLETTRDMLKDAIGALEPNWVSKGIRWIAKTFF